jgi:DNA primase
MARIPEHEVERLKAEVSVERLAEARGVKLERRGADLFGLCPFHEDHNPSLVISPTKNLWHCLGCGKGGSAIDWVEKCHGVSFRHAIELLRANHPSLAAPGPAARSRGTTAAVKLDAPFKLDADDQSALNQVVDYYHHTLKQSPEALRYLQQRGLEHPEMIDRFRLGFSNRTLCYRLPESNR